MRTCSLPPPRPPRGRRLPAALSGCCRRRRAELCRSLPGSRPEWRTDSRTGTAGSAAWSVPFQWCPCGRYSPAGCPRAAAPAPGVGTCGRPLSTDYGYYSIPAEGMQMRKKPFDTVQHAMVPRKRTAPQNVVLSKICVKNPRITCRIMRNILLFQCAKPWFNGSERR